MHDPARDRPWYAEIGRWGRLRSKFLLALLIISASLTCSTLLVVQHRVEVQARGQIRQALESSVAAFGQFQLLRETMLERSASLLASQPIVKALMTSADPLTIEDGSAGPWKTVGSDLFVLADRNGRLMALDSVTPDFSTGDGARLLAQSISRGEARDWWFGGGHLFQVFIQPIDSGDASNPVELGVLVLGFEINAQVAAGVRRVASSEVAFRYGPEVVVGTLSPTQTKELVRLPPLTAGRVPAEPVDISLGPERFIAATTDLASGSSLGVSLVVLKSYDEATRSLVDLNRWLLGLGLTAIAAGSFLVYLVSGTFTRPLERLVGGVHALEKGDFYFPLEARGHDEVSELTLSFDRMRRTLRKAQEELLQAERMATIGRMASTVSHDLRHSLTAILAYAEFLAEGSLEEPRRAEFYQEIRLAVNEMTDQLRALLEFANDPVSHKPVPADFSNVVRRALQHVRARPDFHGIDFSASFEGSTAGCFDPGRLERVFLNLLVNAAEAAPPVNGRVAVHTVRKAAGFEFRVSDNGSGIPDEIRSTLFQPFVTARKENGIGLGLALVQKIIQEHGGQVTVERTGTDGTVLLVELPAAPSDSRVFTQGVA